MTGTHHLLGDPHHDGSEVYVPRGAPGPADAHERWYVAENIYGGADLPMRAGALHLPGDGPGVQVWRLA